MQGVLLVLVAAVGGGEFDANTAYPELSDKVAQVKPAPLGGDALSRQRAQLDASLRKAVRPAGAQAMPRNKYVNPVRTVGYDDELDSKDVQPAQYEQNLRYPRRGVNGSMYGQGRKAATDPTAGSGQRLQPVPPKPGYGSTPKKSPFLPGPKDAYSAKASGGLDSIYADDKDTVGLSGYEPTAGSGNDSADATRRSPGYRPPTRKAEDAANENEAPDLSLMFPEDDESEFKGYGDPEPHDTGPSPSITMTPPAAQKPASIYEKPLPVRSETPAYQYGSAGGEAKPVGHGAPAKDAYSVRPPNLPQPTAPAQNQPPMSPGTAQTKQAPMITTQFPQKPAATSVDQTPPPQYGYPQKPPYGQPTQSAPPVQNRPGYVQPTQQVNPTLPSIPAPRQVADSTRRVMQAGRDNLNKIFENPIPTVTPVPGNNSYVNGNDVQRAETRLRTGGTYFMTLLALFASVGLNFYLGWIAWDTYNRYQDLVADMRYNGARRERGDRRERRLAEGSY